MDKTTPFDLNDAIRRWQQDLAASPAFSADNLEELVAHLRASVQRLQTTGLSEEESFLIASRRLGGPDKLNPEFSKINSALVWQSRAFWMLAGMLASLTVADLAKLSSVALMALTSHFVINGFLLGWIGAAACVSMIAVAGFLLRLLAVGRLSGIGLSIPRWLQRPRIAIPIVFCGAILLKLAVGGVEIILYHSLAPRILGQALVISQWLNAIGGFAIILLILIALAWSALSRRAVTRGFTTGLLILTSGLMFFSTSRAHASPASPSCTQSGQTALEQTIATWKTDTNAAVDKFLALDRNHRPLFSTGNILGFSEQQFVAMPTAARDALSRQMMDDIQTIRLISSAVNQKGRDALAKGDHATAEKCFAQLQQSGVALDKPNSLLLLKMVGHAMNKLGTNQLATLKK